jgi:uncharacterized protein with GYD domain
LTPAETGSIVSIRRAGRDQNRGEGLVRKLTKGHGKDEVTYFFLIKSTKKGAEQSAAQKKDGMNDVTKVVRREGGKCHLYSTKDAPFDYVSVITGTTKAAAVRIAAEIEQGGAVKATQISGIEIFYTP